MTKSFKAWLCWPLVAVVLGVPMMGQADSDETVPAAKSSPSVLIQTSPVQQVRLTETLTTYGTVEFSPEYVQAMDVMTEVMVNQVFVAAGQRVRRGSGCGGATRCFHCAQQPTLNSNWSAPGSM
ncbi:MAG: hypothetical protein HYX62_02135 [Gammaproteobacteria bacterium]|nr:hypothetical protein [Gammaproteobacteria bacterium]